MLIILGILYHLSLSDCALLLWSTQKLDFPAFTLFNQDDYEQLLKDLKEPNVIPFSVDIDKAADVIPRKLGNLYSSYIPMTTFFIEESQDLTDDLSINSKIIKDSLENYKSNANYYENVLVAIFCESSRVKREDKDPNTTETNIQTTQLPTQIPTQIPTQKPITEKPEEPPPIDFKGPVLYDGEGSVLLYSSQPPMLRLNSTIIYLPPAKSVTIDVRARDGYTRLSPTISMVEGKILLRFKFHTSHGHWSLTSVEVVNQLKDESITYNLSIIGTVSAPNHFSYHCHKDTVFKDASGNVELILYKIQAQPDAKNGRFCDAYNCVNFMSGPIWSGILVTASLIVGFFIALAALGDIKTMDKFDNYKTKQLNITVAE
ncbi:uncharacterized protein VhaAC45R [Onthophagus taurus]|uniref:uncharacterized protein VhaAC45R n=1 Tax=Onthophagus taurus TaxID=166361 RepID=UPI0039BDE858